MATQGIILDVTLCFYEGYPSVKFYWPGPTSPGPHRPKEGKNRRAADKKATFGIKTNWVLL